MELKELANFLKIAEYENITRASEDLHIAQPHLTRQLQQLEQELGVALFIREKKRLHITAEGRFLKQQARELLGLAEKTKAQIAEMESGLSGTLYIGSIETVGTTYLPNWIAGFRALFPKVRYNLWSANSADVVERLEKGLIDLGLVRAPIDLERFEALPLLKERWIVVLHADHPLARSGRPSVTLAELASEELLVPTQRISEVAGWFSHRGLSSTISCGFSPLVNGLIMAQCDLGIAVLPESCRRMIYTDEIVVRELAEPLESSVAFIWRRGYELSGAARRFLEFVREHPAGAGHTDFDMN